MVGSELRHNPADDGQEAGEAHQIGKYNVKWVYPGKAGVLIEGISVGEIPK